MRTVDRILATSDIHGQNTRFLNLLKEAQYDPDRDLLIMCGDHIDRGMENLDTLATVQSLVSKGAVALRGNHEQFLIEVIQNMLTDPNWPRNQAVDVWARHNGGAEMLEEIQDLPEAKLREIIEFITGLPNYFTIGNYIFTHAGVNPKKTMKQNTEDDFVWADSDFAFRPAYRGKTIIFGHTPTWNFLPSVNARNDAKQRKHAKIWYDPIHKDKICVDTGSVFGGRLAALEIPSRREFYV
ncbi:MAG: apaH [Firmicutes bacterium]|nr:apaH [Bacillota bacterium]